MGYGTGHAVVAARCRVALRLIGGYRWGGVPLLSRVAGWMPKRLEHGSRWQVLSVDTTSLGG